MKTADWVYLPLERSDKLAKPLRDLTCWPGLSKAKFGQLWGTLELSVHVVNASSKPRVLKAKCVLGSVQSKPKLTGCDTYLLKDEYVEFLEGASRRVPRGSQQPLPRRQEDGRDRRAGRPEERVRAHDVARHDRLLRRVH